MQLEIRFCPFCGEQPELLVAPCQSGEWHAVYCKTCGGGQADDSYDLAAVIAAWNRRAPGPDAAGLLAALSWFVDDIDGKHTVMVDFDANVARARAAIAKYRGGPT